MSTRSKSMSNIYYDKQGRAHSVATGAYTKDPNKKSSKGNKPKQNKNKKSSSSAINGRGNKPKKQNDVYNDVILYPIQEGGFPILAPLLAAAAQTAKPATRLQKLVNNSAFGKTKGGEIVSGILEVPKLLGFGPANNLMPVPRPLGGRRTIII